MHLLHDIKTRCQQTPTRSDFSGIARLTFKASLSITNVYNDLILTMGSIGTLSSVLRSYVQVLEQYSLQGLKQQPGLPVQKMACCEAENIARRVDRRQF